jgi:HEAT repeat protein
MLQQLGLVRLFSSKNQTERWVSARALGYIGDERTTPALIQRLRDRASDVRYAAAKALGECADSTAIEPLRRLRNDATPERSNERGRGAAGSPEPDALYYTNLINAFPVLVNASRPSRFENL